MFPSSIRAKFITSFFGLAVGPLLLVGLLVGSFAYQDHTEIAQRHQQEVAKRVGAEALAFLQQMEYRLQQTAQYSGLISQPKTEQRHLLSTLLERTQLFKDLCLVDSEANTLIHLSSTRLLGEADHKSYAEHHEFVKGKATRQFYADRVFFDRETGEPLIRVAQPIIDLKTGKVISTLMGTGQLTAIWTLVAQINRNDADDIYILDSNQRVVAHRNPSIVLKGSAFFPDESKSVQTGISGKPVVIGMHKFNFGQQTFYVVAERRTSQALIPAERSVKLTLLVIFITLLGATALIIYSIRQIINPIHSLADSVNEVDQGNLTSQIDIKRDDEIGQLASSINNMTANLNESIASLAKSEERYRLLIENQNDLIVKFTTDGYLLFVTPAYCETFGKSEEELIGHKFIPLVHEDDQPAVETSLKSLFKPPHTTRHEERAKTVHGWRWFSWSARAVLNDAGEVTEIVSVGRDITEQKEAAARVRESEERVRLLLDSAGEGIFGIDLDGLCTFANPESLRLLGYQNADEIIGKNIHHLVHHSYADGSPYLEDDCPIYETFRATSPVKVKGEHFWRKDNSSFPAEYSAYPLHDEGITSGCVVIFSDITEQLLAEENLQLSQKIIENAQEGIVITDLDGTIIEVNQAYETITGFSRDEAIGSKPNINKSGRHDKAFYDAMWDSLARDGEWQGEIWDRRKSGEVYPTSLFINAVMNDKGEITHYVGIFSDITLQKNTEEELQKLAYYDNLTNLPNRILFNERLNQIIAVSSRLKTNVALLFIDLDHFKYVNDTLGHAAGDQLLEIVAGRLCENVRESDTVSRLGGDEFTIILTNIDSADSVAPLAQNIVDALKEPIELMGHKVRVGGSIGISLYPDDGTDSESLIKHADTAMYKAKEKGRNNYQFFTPEMNAHVADRLVMEAQLHRALENEEFLLHYQPKIDLNTGQVIGMEALVRWNHPETGMVSPAKFIPVAEETDIIIQLGDWIIETACRQAVAWSKQLGRELKLAVNLSARQFHQSELLTSVESIIHNTGINPEYLEFEITESMVMGDVEEATFLMHHLRDLGVELSIDDFGTGFSSLNYLKRFPINSLKVDQSFVRDLAIDNDDASIVRSIISLGHSLGLSVVAEGVESQEQMDFLRDHHCDQAQGYFISRPLSSEDFEEMLLGSHQTAKE